MTKSATTLARSIETIGYAQTLFLEAERTRQLRLGRRQSLKLLTAIEAELKARANNGGKRPNIEDYLG